MADQFEERQRIEALQKWARRVFGVSAHIRHENRRGARTGFTEEVTLIPLDADTLRPRDDKEIHCVTKDESDSGISVISNIPVDGELFFIEIVKTHQLLLARLARRRQIQGSIEELGFMVLDRYRSWSDLRDEMARNPS